MIVLEMIIGLLWTWLPYAYYELSYIIDSHKTINSGMWINCHERKNAWSHFISALMEPFFFYIDKTIFVRQISSGKNLDTRQKILFEALNTWMHAGYRL